MKFVCSGSDLYDVTSKLKPALSGNSTIEILKGIKIEAHKDRVVFTASDNDTIIEKSIIATVLIEGRTVVEGRFFCELISRLKGSQIEIVGLPNNQMTIKYDDNIVDAACYNYDDYPKPQELDRSKSFGIIRAEFSDLVKKIEFCASTDDSRPILKGIFLDVSNNIITGVALDGYRLGKVIKTIERGTGSMSVVVPARPLKEASIVVGTSTECVDVYIDKSFMLIDMEHTRIWIKLLEGDYINYRQVIPTTFGSTITVAKNNLRESIERVKIVTLEEKNNTVVVEVGQSQITLSSKSTKGTAITERVATKLEGVELKIGFNAKFVTDVLTAIDTESVTVKFNTATTPAVLLPVGAGVDDSVLYLILPIRLGQ